MSTADAGGCRIDGLPHAQAPEPPATPDIPCFAQAVVGHPGAGKTTYCAMMQRLLRDGLQRDVAVVNLDPANDCDPATECAIDIKDLISVEEAMATTGLGPNGALLHCMESLEANIEWLVDGLRNLGPKKYVLFDFPGQIELYIHHSSVRNILSYLKKLGCNICIVYLLDCQQCASMMNYMSAVTTCLSSMMLLELPQVNVLTKLDLALRGEMLEYDISCYEDVSDLISIIGADGVCALPNDDPIIVKKKGINGTNNKRLKLTLSLAEVVDSNSMVRFSAISTCSLARIKRLIRDVDRANGYAYTQGAHSEPQFTNADLSVDDEGDLLREASFSNAHNERPQNDNGDSHNEILERLDLLQRQHDF